MRAFDRDERDRVVTTAPTSWISMGDGRSRFSLGRFTLPSPGSLRVVVCPTPLADPHATVIVAPARTRANGPGAPVSTLPGNESVTLTADESRGKRCFDGTYRTDHAGDVFADLIVRGSSSGAIARVETMASRRITPAAMWPVLLMSNRQQIIGATSEGVRHSNNP